MEYIEGDTAAESATWPNDARETVEEAVRKLHSSLEICEDPTLYFQRVERSSSISIGLERWTRRGTLETSRGT